MIASPYEKCEVIENVQEYCTCMAFWKVFVGPCISDYEASLGIFNLEPLGHCRLKFDLTLCFEITNCLSDSLHESLFTHEYPPYRFQQALETCSMKNVF